ncbi:T-cell-specific surface glycoprotein CD28 isoform X2 [Protopterus annectens]|uniref:T-cell-specific surface glycoprotein CD28 isoform X2 n=1 Tax=Protopterus annectens TaxID=7888 RepID=UPI001CFB1C00|nr:T-cell-specific surface glycoprotein CD28 isoform X2 [Protopterus annectens]
MVCIMIIAILIYTAAGLNISQPLTLTTNTSDVVLHCPFSLPANTEEFKAVLHRNYSQGSFICGSTFNITSKVTSPHNGSQCIVTADNTTLSFFLSNLTPKDTAVYECIIEVMYPPPYQKKYGNGTLIDVNGVPPSPVPCVPNDISWIYLAVILVLGIYGIFMTGLMIICWKKGKVNGYGQADYMNMTPRRPINQKYHPYAPQPRTYPKYC